MIFMGDGKFWGPNEGEKVKKELVPKDADEKEESKESLDGQGVTSKELELGCDKCRRILL